MSSVDEPVFDKVVGVEDPVINQVVGVVGPVPDKMSEDEVAGGANSPKCTTKVGKRKKSTKDGLPKKNRSSFMLYCQEQRPKIVLGDDVSNKFLERHNAEKVNAFQELCR